MKSNIAEFIRRQRTGKQLTVPKQAAMLQKVDGEFISSAIVAALPSRDGGICALRFAEGLALHDLPDEKPVAGFYFLSDAFNRDYALRNGHPAICLTQQFQEAQASVVDPAADAYLYGLRVDALYTVVKSGFYTNASCMLETSLQCDQRVVEFTNGALIVESAARAAKHLERLTGKPTLS